MYCHGLSVNGECSLTLLPWSTSSL